MRRRLSNFLIDLNAQHAFSVIDRLAYWRRCALTVRSNRAFRKEHPGFAVPPLPILWDAQATTDLVEYKRSGEETASQYWDLMRPYLEASASRPQCVCEWGCGPARIIRHLPRLASGWSIEFYGSDYNRESIRWCRENLHDVTFVENGLAPPLRETARPLLAAFAMHLRHRDMRIAAALLRPRRTSRPAPTAGCGHS